MKRLIIGIICWALINGPAFAVPTTHGYFDKPPYGAYGPAHYLAFNAALDATDIFLHGLSPLPDLIANWVGTVDTLTLIETSPGYSAANTFTLAGDFSTVLTAGKRLVADCGADGLQPNTVVSCTYAAPTSTVVVTAANLTANLAAVSYYATRNGLNTYGSGDIVASEFGAPSWANLQSAVAVANASGRRLLLTPGTWPVSDNLAITAPLHPVPGALLQVATTKTLTVSGDFQAGLYQVFSCVGTGTVAFAAGTTVYSSWFADLTTTLTSIGSVKTRLLITKSETISTDLATNAATILVCLPGNVLSIAVDKTLTINGPLEAGPYQIFDGLGTVSYGALVYVQYGEWSAGSGINIVLTAGNQTIAGVKTFSSFPITPSAAPTTDYQAANKKYVDDSTTSAASVAILQNRQAQNTAGGTATTGSWGIVPINTEYEDAGGIVDATSLPAFSLTAGTYRINATCFFHASVQLAQIRLYNVTDGAVQQNIGGKDIYGSSVYCTAAEGPKSLMLGTFTIADTKQFRVEYSVAVTVSTAGLGRPANRGPEVYAQVEITKQ